MKNTLLYPSLALAALLSACGDKNSTTPPIVEPPSSGNVVQSALISGTVSGLPSGTLRAVLVNEGDGLDEANEGVISGGQLNMPLSKTPSDPLFPLLGGCTFTGKTSSQPNVAIYNGIFVASRNFDSIAVLQEQVVTGGSLNGSHVARMFSDGAATVDGTLRCGGDLINLNITLKQGWNAIEWAATTSGLTFRNLAAQATSTLTAELFPKQVAVYTSENTLTFDTNQTVSLSARLYQEGGFTGQVSLSTDLPGLTIEPGTIDLSSARLGSTALNPQGRLLALSLGQQRVDTTLTFRYAGNDNYNGPVKILVKDASGSVVGGGQVTVNILRPGVSLVTYNSTVEVTSGGTATVGVQAYSTGNFTGSVTYSLENLPTGVTATPVTQDMNGYSSINLAVSAAAGMAPGTYPIKVRATTAKSTSTLTLDLVVKAPTVTLAGSGYDSVTVYQGGSGSLQVQVRTDNTFNGTTTVTLTDLPAGVTATPRTIAVQPGAITTVNIPVSASADTVLGTYTVKVSSPDMSATTATQRTLLISPARTQLNTSVSMSADAAEGVWISAGSTYDSTTQGSVTRVQRVSTSGSVLTDVTLPGAYTRLVTAGADVIALSSYSGAPVKISADGTQTPLATLPTGTSADSAASRLDAQGRLWLSSMTWGVGAAQAQVFAWDPVSGAVSFKQPATTATSAATLRVSPDGSTLLVTPYSSYGTPVQKITTSTGQSAALEAVSSAASSSAAFASDGTIWFGSYSGLTRVNADGTLTTFQNNLYVGVLYGFDRQTPNILWASNGSAVLRIDVSSMQVQTIPVDSPSAGYVAAQGGLKLITLSYSAGNTYYLSLLK